MTKQLLEFHQVIIYIKSRGDASCFIIICYGKPLIAENAVS